MTAETTPFLDSDMPASPGPRPSTLLAQIICGARHSSRCDLASTSMLASTWSPAANSVATMRAGDAFQVMVCTDAASPGVTSTGGGAGGCGDVDVAPGAALITHDAADVGDALAVSRPARRGDLQRRFHEGADRTAVRIAQVK